MNELVPQPPTSDERNLATIAHLLGIVSGCIGALIIWLLKKDSSAYVADQAREALNFQLTVLIAFVAAAILKIVLIGLLLVPIVLVFNFVLCLVAAVSVSRGEDYRYPFSLRLLN